MKKKVKRKTRKERNVRIKKKRNEIEEKDLRKK